MEHTTSTKHGLAKFHLLVITRFDTFALGCTNKVVGTILNAVKRDRVLVKLFAEFQKGFLQFARVIAIKDDKGLFLDLLFLVGTHVFDKHAVNRRDRKTLSHKERLQLSRALGILCLIVFTSAG